MNTVYMVQDIQKNFRLMNSKMNAQFEELKEYVDDSIIASDNERLVGELSEMNLHLSDCLLIADKAKKEDCLHDHCSYVKAGFKKFAIFEDQINCGQLPTENKMSYAEMINLQRGAKNKKFETLTAQEIKRIFANIPMFNTYVSTVLLRCEMHRVLNEQKKTVEKTEFFEDMDPYANEWNVKKRVLSYLQFSFAVISLAHKSNATVVQHGFIKNYDEPKKWRKHQRKVQCRFQMSSHFKHYCDKEYPVADTSLTLAQAKETCEEELPEIKRGFDITLDEEKMVKFL